MIKKAVLEEILGGLEISDFSRKWVENSDTNKENIGCTYEILKRIGLKDDKIAYKPSTAFRYLA